MKRQSLEAQLNELLDEDITHVIERERTAFDLLVSPFGDSLVLFGAGHLGMKTLAGLRKIGIEPLAFADNNSKLWNSRIEGIEVLSPQDAAHKYGSNAAFVITIWRALGGDRQAQRREQLIKLGCQKVASFGQLFWKYPDVFMPHYCLDLPHKFHEHRDELRKAFYLWSDDDSRRGYLAQLRFRLLMDFNELPSPVLHPQYFADDLFDLLPNEMFIDCGAYDGDTIKEFLHRRGLSFNEIIAFEPDPVNFQNLQEYTSSLVGSIKDKITCLQLAVGANKGKLRFEAKGTVQSAVTETGDLVVDCVPMDEFLVNKMPTFLKMDIEGAEVDAMIGVREVLQKARPTLAICVYHRPDHLWRIPLIIDSISNDYHFYLRPHDEEGWDLVCYAIPSARLKS